MKTTVIGATLNEIEAVKIVLPRLAKVGVHEPERIGGERKMRIVKTGFEILFLIFRERRTMKTQPKRKLSA